MIDYLLLFPVMWLLPVSLQIVLPLLILFCWMLVKVPAEFMRNEHSAEPAMRSLEQN